MVLDELAGCMWRQDLDSVVCASLTGSSDGGGDLDGGRRVLTTIHVLCRFVLAGISRPRRAMLCEDHSDVLGHRRRSTSGRHLVNRGDVVRGWNNLPDLGTIESDDVDYSLGAEAQRISSEECRDVFDR